MEQLDNAPTAGQSTVFAHLPPGTYSTDMAARLTHYTTDQVVTTAARFVRQTDRAVEVTIAAANLQDGMWLLEIGLDGAFSPVLFTALAYLSRGGNTAVPSNPTDYTATDNDRAYVYYE